ncbi:MAG: aldo/keto reductase [Nitrospiraceae bacterium]|nr:aldo/keto reductase [Nitrospiraceae bacterium]
MKYRRFGKTNLEIPVITCGGMRFQQSWNSDDPIEEEKQRNVEACVRRSLELGIHHFETARGYGTSEEQLGRILPDLPRSEIIVQTKVGPTEDPQQFVDNFEKSMNLLKLDYIDIFSIHGINDQQCLDFSMRCFERALMWKREGRVRHIGFATHGPTDIIIKTICTGAFESVNLHWHYIFQDNWQAIEEARQRDMGVYIISPNEKGGLLFKPSEKLAELTAPLHPMVFNGLFLLARPEVHSLSCGVSKPEDFDIHMETADRLHDAANLTAPIVQRLREAMVRALGEAWTDTWQEGLPEWHETPGGINIPWILRLRNLALAYDMVEFGKMRYNLLGNGGHWFPGNKADKLDKVDPEELQAALANSPHAAVIPEALAEAHALLVGEERKRLQRDDA